MSFGMYRPVMGVPGGHRATTSDNTILEQRRLKERYARQENPITHECAGDSRGQPAAALGVGLVPLKGPMDHMTVLEKDKDVPAKRVDPTRNQSSSLTVGGGCVPVPPDAPQRGPSRITESAFEAGGGFAQRAATPERRNTPGQVVRGGLRPKDNLSGGALITADRQDHPLALPRKAGSAAPGTGSGGSGHLIAGPNGLVPLGPTDSDDLPSAGRPSSQSNQVPFQRACGLRASAVR
mmetsp:Transcript_19372/g.42284  ORF Transcript_19372/g.42284 Transcript_19372/m.42284 type:complete len:237 (+) Transcript_19372:123-833(+)